MKDYSIVADIASEIVGYLHDRIELDLLSTYNAGYEAGLKQKDYVESHCTGCAYEGVAYYKEPCKDCRNSHQNLYKERREYV